jgi:outer membrane autotransporter protein
MCTETKRQISVGSIEETAYGDYDGNEFAVAAEGGYTFNWGKVVELQPFLGLTYTRLSQDAFDETGAGAYGLQVNSVDMDSVRTALGARLAADYKFKNGMKLVPEARAAWEHEWADRGADVNAQFIGGSPDFVVRGVRLNRESCVLGAGFTVAFNKTIQAFVNYDAQLNKQLSSSTVSGGLDIAW